MVDVPSLREEHPDRREPSLDLFQASACRSLDVRGEGDLTGLDRPGVEVVEAGGGEGRLETRRHLLDVAGRRAPLRSGSGRSPRSTVLRSLRRRHRSGASRPRRATGPSRVPARRAAADDRRARRARPGTRWRKALAEVQVVLLVPPAAERPPRRFAPNGHQCDGQHRVPVHGRGMSKPLDGHSSRRAPPERREQPR